MKKRKNIYATTNWKNATFSLRVKSLITMFCSFCFLDSIFCSLWVYIFIIRRVYIKFENGAKLEDYNMADKIFFGIFLVTLGTYVFAFVLYVIRGFKLLFGKAMYCNARITFVEKKRGWRFAPGYADKYTITFQYGADGVVKSKTIDEEEYSKNFHPKKYNGEYITVVTPDMKYFILRKRYRVKKKRGKNIGKRKHK